MLQAASVSPPIPEIQLPVRSDDYLRSFLRAMAANLSRAKRPSVLVVPDKDRHELRHSMEFIAGVMNHCDQPRFVTNDRDFEDYCLQESHHTRPVVHLKGESISLDLQEEILYRWDPMPITPPFTLFVLACDPGELYQKGLWNRNFREFVHMPTFRWPETTRRYKTPSLRMRFFTKVFEDIASKHLPERESAEPIIEPGARDLLLSAFFTEFKPAYVGNYVKLAVDLIAMMKKFGEARLTAKVVLTITAAEGHDFSLVPSQ